MAPSPPAIKITLALGAFGLIRTDREPPTLTVSSAAAGAEAKAESNTTAPKHDIHLGFVTCSPLLMEPRRSPTTPTHSAASIDSVVQADAAAVGGHAGLSELRSERCKSGE